MKIKVCVNKMLDRPINTHCIQMIGKLNGIDEVDVEYGEGPYGFKNRNSMVKDDDLNKYDHFVFINQDISHQDPMNTILRLIDRNVNIVGAACTDKDTSNHFNAMDCAYGSQYVPISKKIIGLRKVDIISADFLVVTSMALKIMKRPYFRHEFQGEDQTDEQTGFCIEANRRGLHIYLDADTKVTKHN